MNFWLSRLSVVLFFCLKIWIYPCHINTMPPHCHPVLLHLELWLVVPVQMIREINTLHFVLQSITPGISTLATALSPKLNRGNCLLSLFPLGLLLLLLLITTSPEWIINTILKTLFSPKRKCESCFFIVVIESIKPVIINFSNWLGWPAFPCLGSTNTSNANTPQSHLAHNLQQSKIIVCDKNKISVFCHLLSIHSW